MNPPVLTSAWGGLLPLRAPVDMGTEAVEVGGRGGPQGQTLLREGTLELPCFSPRPVKVLERPWTQTGLTPACPDIWPLPSLLWPGKEKGAGQGRGSGKG